MTNQCSWFNTFTSICQPQILHVEGIGGVSIHVAGIGDIQISVKLDDGYENVILKDVLYVPCPG